MTQKVVARALKVSQFSVINWERGDFQPSNVFTLHRIVKFLGYDPAPPYPQTLSDRVRAKRREMGWGQRELAGYLGVDRCSVTKWERGGTIMKRAHRTLLATLLGLNDADLMRDMADRWNASHGKRSVRR